MYNSGDERFVRISKPTAKRAVKDGATVLILPWKFRFDNQYIKPIPITHDVDFDTFVRDYEIYNCTCRQTGKYASFYLDSTTYDLSKKTTD